MKIRWRKVTGWIVVVACAGILGILCTYPANWATDLFQQTFPAINAFIYQNAGILIIASLLVGLLLLLPRTMLAVGIIAWLAYCPIDTIACVICLIVAIVAVLTYFERGEHARMAQ